MNEALEFIALVIACGVAYGFFNSLRNYLIDRRRRINEEQQDEHD